VYVARAGSGVAGKNDCGGIVLSIAEWVLLPQDVRTVQA
jgi:hypothetical protein